MPDIKAAALAELRLESDSTARTEAIGVALGRRLQPGDVICLSGALGAGKTVVSRGIGKSWGAEPALTSPTYNLVHEHRRARDDQRLAHVDLYRISGPDEAETLGLSDLIDEDYIVIVEWPERIRERLPQAHLWIDIELVNDQRRELLIQARGLRYEAVVDGLRRDIQIT